MKQSSHCIFALDVYWMNSEYFFEHGGNAVNGNGDQRVARYHIGNDTVVGKTVGREFHGTVNNQTYFTEERYKVDTLLCHRIFTQVLK